MATIGNVQRQEKARQIAEDIYRRTLYSNIITPVDDDMNIDECAERITECVNLLMMLSDDDYIITIDNGE